MYEASLLELDPLEKILYPLEKKLTHKKDVLPTRKKTSLVRKKKQSMLKDLTKENKNWETHLDRKNFIISTARQRQWLRSGMMIKWLYRRSRLQMFFKIGALKKFANFTGKHFFYRTPPVAASHDKLWQVARHITYCDTYWAICRR